MKRTTPFIVVGLLLFAGCQYDPWADGFQTHQVADNDVVGKYVIDANSQKREITLPLSNSIFPVNKAAQIVLSADHRAEFSHVSVEHMGTKACSVTGQGSWKIGKNESFTVVRASITNEEPASICKGEIAYELDLYGKKPPYKLHMTIGDPDSGDAVQFEKQ